MNWSHAAPALVEAGIGLLLLVIAAAMYLAATRRRNADGEGNQSVGCVALILTIIGAIALYYGVDAFNELVRAQ